jgi:GNAT superfamily N-acetyltransferase
MQLLGGSQPMQATSALSIRRFQPTDAAAVWSLHNRALSGTKAHVGNGPWDDDVQEPQSHYLDRGGEFLVGFIGEKLVAMAAYLPLDAKTVQVKRMRVVPEGQRKGYGKRILGKLESLASRQGYTNITLDTTREQVAAQQLYLAAGYVIVGHGRSGRFETVLFEKKLA